MAYYAGYEEKLSLLLFSLFSGLLPTKLFEGIFVIALHVSSNTCSHGGQSYFLSSGPFSLLPKNRTVERYNSITTIQQPLQVEALIVFPETHRTLFSPKSQVR